MNKKILEKQIQVLCSIKDDLETIINHPNRNILDIIMVDYVILQRDIVENAIQQTTLIKRIDNDNELIKNREEENYNIINSIHLDNIFIILNR